MARRITAPRIQRMKGKGKKVVMVTAYDATFARLVDSADVDAVLVGDSLGNVIQGHETTLPVTLEEMIYHTRCVSRGLTRPLLVGDLPFLSYQASVEQAVISAGRLMKEGRANAVKLEGGACMAKAVRRLVDIGIPVMGHIGLTPQSVHAFGGMKIQGREDQRAEQILADAKALEEAGVFSIVLEGLPTPLAKRVTESVEVPTIGISAGPHCDGQVLVLYDMLALDETFKPRFVKHYASMGATVVDALNRFSSEVREGAFPDEEHSFE